MKSASTTGRDRSASGCSATRARSACTPRSSTPQTARQLGNYPQAFTHLALINAVIHVVRADQQEMIDRSPWVKLG